MFPPKIWAEFVPTTNRMANCCEAFHVRLNNLFYAVLIERVSTPAVLCFPGIAH